MDNFINEDDAIEGLMSSHVPSFFRGNEMREHRLEMVVNEFGDDFVKDIAESHGSVLTQSDVFVFFGNEGEEGGIEF